MLNHLDTVTRTLPKWNTAWKEDRFFGVELACQLLSKYYAEVTPTTDMLIISAHILNPFRMLRSVPKCVQGIDVNSEEKTSHTTQHQEAILQ